MPSPTPLVATVSSAALGLAAVQRGDGAGTLRQYSELEGAPAIMLPGGMVSIDRVRGLLLQASGRLADAMVHFEAALSFCRGASQPEFAWVCCDYADALLQRGSAADNEMAASLIGQALSITEALGMQAVTERVRALQAKFQGTDSRVQFIGDDSSEIKTSIEAVVSAVGAERPELGVHASPDGTVTMLFSDIEGSTDLTERLGDQRAQELFRVHNELVREQIASHSGFEVKSMGDGFMVAFSSGRRALQSAIGIQRALATYNQENPYVVVRVRIGLHTGEMIKESEDFFGRNVILAARIAAKANGGQVLASSLVKELSESSGEFEFDEGRDLAGCGKTLVHGVSEALLG